MGHACVSRRDMKISVPSFNLAVNLKLLFEKCLNLKISLNLPKAFCGLAGRGCSGGGGGIVEPGPGNAVPYLNWVRGTSANYDVSISLGNLDLSSVMGCNSNWLEIYEPTSEMK